MTCTICIAKTKTNGQRCKRKISCHIGCKKYCWQHATSHNAKHKTCKDDNPERKSKRNKPIVLKVKKSKIKGAGQGLFAGTGGISKGTEIVRMSDPIIVSSEQDVEDRGLPHDSVIHISGNTKNKTQLVFDAAFIDMDHIPLWYRQNHSSTDPNSRVKRKSNKIIYWQALRDIDEGEEIVFDYEPGRKLFE